MHKIVIVVLSAVAFVASCSRFDDSSLINFDYRTISDVHSTNMIVQETLEDISFSKINNIFKDTLLITFLEDTFPFVFSVSNSQTDSLIGSFCPKGRSAEEPLSVIPFLDLYEENGSTTSLFFSYSNNRFFKWNISRSLEAGKTLYNKVIPVKVEDGSILPTVSYYSLPQGKIILQNTHQTLYSWMVEPTTYEIYDTKTGEREKQISPFALYEGKETMGEDGLFGSKMYLSLEDCIKPTRDKLAFGMMFIPYFAVLDINTGDITGIRLAKYPGLNPNRKFFHFVDVECNDDFIFALYCGGETETFNSPEYSEIFIFDWDCLLKGKIKVVGAHQICLDGDIIHLLNYETGKSYRLKLDEIKLSL